MKAHFHVLNFLNKFADDYSQKYHDRETNTLKGELTMTQFFPM